MFKIVHLKKIIIFCIIIFFILGIFYYKKIFCGNNIVKNRVNKILYNLKNYETDLEIEILNNPQIGKYKMHQKVNENEECQTVYDENGKEILQVKYSEKNLEIVNDKLNLRKQYSNYSNLANNALFLSTFAKEYELQQDTAKMQEENEQIIIEIEQENYNTYTKYSVLYLECKTLNPVKMEIKDKNYNTIISIKYNNMEIK